MLRLVSLILLVSVSTPVWAETPEELTESKRLTLELQLRKAARFTSTSTHAWSLRPYGGFAHGMALATGPDGSVYVAGIVGQQALLGGLPVFADGDLETPFLARYGPRGGHLWSRSVFEGQSARIWSIDVAPDRSFFLAMGRSSTVTTESDFRFEDTVIEKRDAAGRRRWRRVLSNPWPAQVASASDGGVFVAAPLEGPLVIDGEVVDRDPRRRSLLMRFDAEGDLRSVRRLGQKGLVWVLSLTRGPEDRIVATGMLYAVTGGGRHGFVAVLSSDGESVFETRLSGSGPSRLWAASFCGKGRVAVLGDSSGPSRLGTTKLLADSSFVAMLDGEGAPRWVRSIYGPSRASGVSCSSSGQVHAVLDFSQVVELDERHLESAGEDDVLYMVWDAEGRQRLAQVAGGQGPDHAIAIDARVGGAAVLGSFSGSIDWGGGPLSTEHETMFLFRAADDTSVAPGLDPR